MITISRLALAITILASTLLGSGVAVAQAPSPLLGKLEPGPHAVGFRTLERSDVSRPFRSPVDLEGRPRAGEIGRPVQISVWYPAVKSNRPPMRLRDYVLLMGKEQRFDVEGPEQQRLADQAFFRLELLQTTSTDVRTKLLDLPMAAVADAEPASGRFPTILWSFGSPALYQASAEYLASHGYVVAIVPRIPELRGQRDSSLTLTDFEMKSRDMAFLINELSRLPFADITRLGVTGFSAGGHWALAESMRNPAVRAVVSLDSVMLFTDDNGVFTTLPFVHPDRQRVPVLHLVRREWVPQERSPLWDQMRYAPRTHVVFEPPALDHFDFASIGFATLIAGLRKDQTETVTHTFEAVNRMTLWFFDAHVRGDAAAAQRLAAMPEALRVPPGFMTVTRKTAPVVPTEVQLRDALTDDLEGALKKFRSAWKESGTPPLPEDTVNLAGYELLNAGRVADSVKLFALNVEVFPSSANVYDSLSDAYLAAGDEKKALELAEKALALLPADASPPARKTLIEQSARTKVDRLRRPL